MSDSKISIPHAKVLSLVANPRSRRFLVRIIIVCGVFHFGFMLFVLGCLALGAVEPRVGIRTALPFLFLGLLSLRAYALVREKGMVEA